MKIRLTAALAALIMLSASRTLFSAPAPAPESEIARGKYLVDAIAKCSDCHSPLNEKGEPVPGKEFRGALLSFKPTVPMPAWADKAPNIAGLPGWERKDAVKLLMTGLAYNDLPPRPPMPQFKMNKQDAEAVVAYLKSLSPKAK